MRSGTAVARLRAFAAVPEMVAIRTALPYSFVGLVLGIATFIALQPSGEFLSKFYRAFAPAFGIMAALLLVLLTIDLAQRRDVPPGAAVAIARAVVALLAVSRARLGWAAGTFVAASLAIGVAALLFFFGISLTEWLDVAIAPLGTLGDSLAALLVITLVETLLRTIGIHGPALLAAVVLPVYLQLQFENTEAMAHGLPLPHVVTVSTFLFVFPGGAGATLPLVMLLLRHKIKRARQVALATLVPTLFNANAPLLFG